MLWQVSNASVPNNGQPGDVGPDSVRRVAVLTHMGRPAAIAAATRLVEGLSAAGIVAALPAGDLPALDRQALQPLRKASPNLFRRLVTERNARWTRTLDQRLKGKGRTVVVVGIGHLIGQDGVPARLRALGYKVEGP